MKLVIGTDHRGLEFKDFLLEKLNGHFDIVDLSSGNYEEYDYPDFAFKVSRYVLEHEDSLGILICGTGIGMSIAANKVKGIRCALVHDLNEAGLAREHNNANIMAIGSNMDRELALNCISKFASTAFSIEEKHQRRVNKIINYENGAYDEL